MPAASIQVLFAATTGIVAVVLWYGRQLIQLLVAEIKGQ